MQVSWRVYLLVQVCRTNKFFSMQKSFLDGSRRYLSTQTMYTKPSTTSRGWWDWDVTRTTGAIWVRKQCDDSAIFVKAASNKIKTVELSSIPHFKSKFWSKMWDLMAARTWVRKRHTVLTLVRFFLLKSWNEHGSLRNKLSIFAVHEQIKIVK